LNEIEFELNRMCGIIGYKGWGTTSADAHRVIFDSLKKLEYRGYDSWGIATLRDSRNKARAELRVERFVGKIRPVNLRSLSPAKIGIGHTRWATHGGVTKANAHPHVSCDGGIAVVHNGIIENWKELKKEMTKKGHRFSSETDTEVMAHLIEEYAKKAGFENAAIKAISRLKGSWAVLAIKEGADQMIAARKDSPLVLGIGKNEVFAASDIPAFIDKTKNVMYLYDNDVAILDGNIRVYNLKTKREMRRVVDSIDWDVEQAKKGDFAHFMLKEIAEQASVLKRSAERDAKPIKKLSRWIKTARSVFMVGAGTSFHACLSGSYFFSKIAGKSANVILASEFPNYENFLSRSSLVIAVSQSGETADVLEAVRAAKKRGARVIAIVNVRGSTLTRLADDFLLMQAGPEISVLSTKTYTSQLALLLLLAYELAGKLSKGRDELTRAWNLAFNLTARSTREHIEKLAWQLAKKEHIFAIGRDLQYPTALEAALKIKEVSYIHAEGFAGGELKHGTIALIDKGTPCIVFAGKETENSILSNAAEVKARGGYIIGIGPRKHDVFDYWIKVPDLGFANSIGQIIPIQVLAYQLAVLKGLDPDKPRHLAKSVTVK